MALDSTLKRTMRFFIIFNWLCCIYNNNIKLGQSEKEWGCNWWEEFHPTTYLVVQLYYHQRTEKCSDVLQNTLQRFSFDRGVTSVSRSGCDQREEKWSELIKRASVWTRGKGMWSTIYILKWWQWQLTKLSAQVINWLTSHNLKECGSHSQLIVTKCHFHLISSNNSKGFGPVFWSLKPNLLQL